MKKQDEEFYREIYILYDKDVKAFLKHYFPGIGEEDARDIAQEVWEQFGLDIAAAQKRTDRENRSWLLTVARNKAIDWIRSNARRYRRETELDVYEPLLSSKVYLPDDILEKMIAEDILRELSKEEKIFFRDEFCGPKSDKLQDNAKTCKKYRLRRKLERKMDEADFHPGSEW